MATSKKNPGIDIGISENDRAKIAEGLSRFLAQRMQIHEKNAWMLRSLLEE